MRRRPADPSWITVRYPGQCSRCAQPIQKGAQAFYYPNTRSLLCDGDNCGQQAARDLNAAKFDEANCTL